MDTTNTNDIKKQLDKAYSTAADKKDYATALLLCEAVIRDHPELVDGLRMKAQIHAHNADFSEAIEDITRVIERDPTEPGDLFFRGWWNLENGKITEAIRDLTESIDLGKSRGLNYHTESAYFFRAVASLQQGSFDDALEDCTHVRDDFLIYLRSGQVSKQQIVKNAKSKSGNHP